MKMAILGGVLTVAGLLLPAPYEDYALAFGLFFLLFSLFRLLIHKRGKRGMRLLAMTGASLLVTILGWNLIGRGHMAFVLALAAFVLWIAILSRVVAEKHATMAPEDPHSPQRNPFGKE